MRAHKNSTKQQLCCRQVKLLMFKIVVQQTRETVYSPHTIGKYEIPQKVT